MQSNEKAREELDKHNLKKHSVNNQLGFEERTFKDRIVEFTDQLKSQELPLLLGIKRQCA